MNAGCGGRIICPAGKALFNSVHFWTICRTGLLKIVPYTSYPKNLGKENLL
jgi:hypothetical protein